MNGRDKGRKAELEAARIVEGWWRRLEPACRFVRTPASGGWHGADVRAEFKTSGDLMTTAARWPFSVEVKRVERGDLNRVLAFKPSPVWLWWAQCCKAAMEDERDPMLWFRRSRSPWIVVLSHWYGNKLEAEGARVLAKKADDMGVVVLEATELLALHPSIVATRAA